MTDEKEHIKQLKEIIEGYHEKTEELLEDLKLAHVEAEAYARGYVELGHAFLGSKERLFTRSDVVTMICNKFDEIREKTKSNKEES